MRLKASVDYGVRAVVYLAMKGTICSSKEIADEMSIPRDYLIRLALNLRTHDVIHARPGKNGGYTLARSPKEINILQIVEALDGDERVSRHPLPKKTDKEGPVRMAVQAHEMLSESYCSFLSSITIQDVLNAGSKNMDPKLFAARALKREGKRMAEEAKKA